MVTETKEKYIEDATKEKYIEDAIIWLNSIDSIEALKLARDLCYHVFYLWKVKGQFQDEIQENT